MSSRRHPRAESAAPLAREVGLAQTADHAHKWQDPDTEEWVFKVSADRSQLRSIPPRRPTPTPETEVLAWLDGSLGLEITADELGTLTGLDDTTLSHVLTALVNNGAIEHVRPGVYRKNT